jgi:hypothetical protein
MKTNLPSEITSIEEAKKFLSELHANGESFHPEDNAHDIDWDLPDEQKPDYMQSRQLNKLMFDIYNLPGNDRSHVNLAFDPCDYLLWLDVNFNDSRLKEAIENGTLEKFTTEYEYVIEKGPDPYNPCYELTLISGDNIIMVLEYNTRQDAEYDVEILEHWLNITEA